jgi:uncharacterized SAM-binding protein YcdF (DUF218 family)
MFIASKLLSFITQPLCWAALLLLAGLLLLAARPKWGVRLCWSALLVLLLQGWEPLPNSVLRQLEEQYAAPDANASLQQYAGIVILGGALEPSSIWQSHGQVALNDAAERMTVPVALHKKYPHLRLLFTGGEGELFERGLTEADRAKIFFDSMGVDSNRLIYESASHTTYENAILSARLPGINTSQPWLLLTSASHMPRSMATFRKAGWNVTAFPVDYRTGNETTWSRFSLAGGAHKWAIALHEIMGLLAYRLANRA